MTDQHRAAIRDEAAKLEVDCEHSSKGHFNASDRWKQRHFMLGIPSTVLAALAAVLGAASSVPEAKWAGVAAAGAAAVLSALTTFLNAAEQAEQHHRAGSSYLSLKARLRQLREVKAKDPSLTSEALASLLEEYQAEKSRVSTDAPQIPRAAYLAAKAGIEQGEAAYPAKEKTPRSKGGA